MAGDKTKDKGITGISGGKSADALDKIMVHSEVGNKNMGGEWANIGKIQRNVCGEAVVKYKRTSILTAVAVALLIVFVGGWFAVVNERGTVPIARSLSRGFLENIKTKEVDQDHVQDPSQVEDGSLWNFNESSSDVAHAVAPHIDQQATGQSSGSIAFLQKGLDQAHKSTLSAASLEPVGANAASEKNDPFRTLSNSWNRILFDPPSATSKDTKHPIVAEVSKTGKNHAGATNTAAGKEKDIKASTDKKKDGTVGANGVSKAMKDSVGDALLFGSASGKSKDTKHPIVPEASKTNNAMKDRVTAATGENGGDASKTNKNGATKTAATGATKIEGKKQGMVRSQEGGKTPGSKNKKLGTKDKKDAIGNSSNAKEGTAKSAAKKTAKAGGKKQKMAPLKRMFMAKRMGEQRPKSFDRKRHGVTHKGANAHHGTSRVHHGSIWHKGSHSYLHEMSNKGTIAHPKNNKHGSKDRKHSATKDAKHAIGDVTHAKHGATKHGGKKHGMAHPHALSMNKKDKSPKHTKHGIVHAKAGAAESAPKDGAVSGTGSGVSEDRAKNKPKPGSMMMMRDWLFVRWDIFCIGVCISVICVVLVFVVGFTPVGETLVDWWDYGTEKVGQTYRTSVDTVTGVWAGLWPSPNPSRSTSRQTTTTCSEADDLQQEEVVALVSSRETTAAASEEIIVADGEVTWLVEKPPAVGLRGRNKKDGANNISISTSATSNSDDGDDDGSFSSSSSSSGPHVPRGVVSYSIATPPLSNSQASSEQQQDATRDIQNRDARRAGSVSNRKRQQGESEGECQPPSSSSSSNGRSSSDDGGVDQGVEDVLTVSEDYETDFATASYRSSNLEDMEQEVEAPLLPKRTPSLSPPLSMDMPLLDQNSTSNKNNAEMNSNENYDNKGADFSFSLFPLNTSEATSPKASASSDAAKQQRGENKKGFRRSAEIKDPTSSTDSIDGQTPPLILLEPAPTSWSPATPQFDSTKSAEQREMKKGLSGGLAASDNAVEASSLPLLVELARPLSVSQSSVESANQVGESASLGKQNVKVVVGNDGVNANWMYMNFAKGSREQRAQLRLNRHMAAALEVEEGAGTPRGPSKVEAVLSLGFESLNSIIGEFGQSVKHVDSGISLQKQNEILKDMKKEYSKSTITTDDRLQSTISKTTSLLKSVSKTAAGENDDSHFDALGDLWDAMPKDGNFYPVANATGVATSSLGTIVRRPQQSTLKLFVKARTGTSWENHFENSLKWMRRKIGSTHPETRSFTRVLEIMFMEVEAVKAGD
ncbi:unnamed protein product [Amoebophrya sp. A25]|nr:unnamed protein product [Amoebophrya sp. A25]|eukprot:GSA25T00020164001.1